MRQRAHKPKGVDSRDRTILVILVLVMQVFLNRRDYIPSTGLFGPLDPSSRHTILYSVHKSAVYVVWWLMVVLYHCFFLPYDGNAVGHTF